MTRVRLADISLPDFGMPDEQPRVPVETQAARVEAARRRAAGAGHDLLVVYADREHSANMAFLTGFEPRFEEAMLILGPSGDPVLAVGNECKGYTETARVPLRVVLFPDFSLMGQDRSQGNSLEAILSGAGIGPGSRVGVVGWKMYGADDTRIDAPAYLVDALRDAVGAGGAVVNATNLFTDPRDGLRVINDVDQLAAFEFAACHTSNGVRNLLFNLKPGLTEFEAARLLQWPGLPLSCHLMVSSGKRAWMGLGSPSDKVIELGDAFTTAFGIWGALNCRAGWVAEDETDLPADVRDYVARLVTPYYTAIVAWYETIGIGVTGGALYDAVHRHIGDPFFGVFLNPGHQIHFDEWVNAPVYEESDIPLRSGMAMQADVIPATGGPYFTTNIEDGIALADEALRGALATRHPAAWARIQARRAFMTDVLGIDLKPEVLPFSNIPAYLPPYLLRPTRIMTASREGQ